MAPRLSVWRLSRFHVVPLFSWLVEWRGMAITACPAAAIQAQYDDVVFDEDILSESDISKQVSFRP